MKFSFDRQQLSSPANAYWMARLATLAYHTQQAIRRETNVFWGVPAVHCFENKATDTQLCILEYDDIAFVGFRGTEGGRDWLTNLHFWKQKQSGFQVHGGFLQSFNSILDERRQPDSYLQGKAYNAAPDTVPSFEGLLRDYADRGLPIILCGHSLGGALATVGAIVLQSMNIPVEAVYSCGQPKILGTAPNVLDRYAQQVCGHVVAGVNDRDAVPCVPTKKLGFKHFDIEYAFDGDGHPITDPAQKLKFQRRVDKGTSFLRHLPEGIGDHSIFNYIRNFSEMTGLP